MGVEAAAGVRDEVAGDGLVALLGMGCVDLVDAGLHRSGEIVARGTKVRRAVPHDGVSLVVGKRGDVRVREPAPHMILVMELLANKLAAVFRPIDFYDGTVCLIREEELRDTRAHSRVNHAAQYGCYEEEERCTPPYLRLLHCFASFLHSEARFSHGRSVVFWLPLPRVHLNNGNRFFIALGTPPGIRCLTPRPKPSTSCRAA